MPGEDRGGLLYGLGAYGFWGLLPLYFRLVEQVPPIEVVAQRVLWSALLVAALVVAAKRGAALRAGFANPRVLALLAASAALIGCNWLLYVWAVHEGQVLAASLAYFLTPLLNVGLGALLGERITRLQWAAIALAGSGVAVLAFGAGGTLWISLLLAFSFAFYGLIRKLTPVGALEGLTIETVWLSPLALGWLLWIGPAARFGDTVSETLLLVLAGAVTTVPLLMFAVAAKRLKLATLGVLQFIAPSLQFVLALVVFGETLSVPRARCSALIWAGLAVYVTGGWLGRRQPVAAAAPLD